LSIRLALNWAAFSLMVRAGAAELVAGRSELALARAIHGIR
jgi:hypothetical protein